MDTTWSNKYLGHLDGHVKYAFSAGNINDYYVCFNK